MQQHIKITSFRLKGSNAFKTALKATKFDSLVKEGAKLYHSASETFKTSAERTKLLSKELGGVRHSAANAVAVLAGKDVTEAPKHLDNDKGLLQVYRRNVIRWVLLRTICPIKSVTDI